MPLRGRSVKLDETLSRCQIKCEEDEKKTNVETYTKASIEYFSIRFPGYLCGETFFFVSIALLSTFFDLVSWKMEV